MDDEIQITASFNGKAYEPITPRQLRALGPRVAVSLHNTLEQLARRINDQVVDTYVRQDHDRPRIKGTPLSERLAQALEARTTSHGYRGMDSVEMHAFDIAKIDALTRNEGKWTSKKGWWDFFNDDRVGRDHGSKMYAFVPFDESKSMAEDCIEIFSLNQTEATELRAYVEEHFRGRHGEGIMMHLHLPVFNRYPQFGTPADLGFTPHEGYYAWDIIDSIAGSDWGKIRNSDHWLLDVLNTAFDQAENHIMRRG